MYINALMTNKEYLATSENYECRSTEFWGKPTKIRVVGQGPGVNAPTPLDNSTTRQSTGLTGGWIDGILYGSVD
jgi:hypothetical protein